MTELEQNILRAIVELDDTVKSMPTANPKPNLLPLFKKLDTLALELPRHTDPNLRHYMIKKSYEKARMFLEGRNAENPRGNCSERKA